ncbi:site-specific integrase [Stieleria sp. ICT_E10.1]|uniref:tyrosine-type recombinase/integrase n=1 Tax=Stieleria sedimenti TaxID=2976331 RepID=UPI00217F803B|nr:site-specific integrase [Stieleria sedimenti]MCS7466114.1 site-specific integrase [Stieleria sedimenti]
MARPRSKMPAYRYHVSGQAVVTLAAKDFYLGEYDSPESRARYFSLLAEYNSNGQQAPGQPQRQAETPITVRCVTGEFREHIKTKYANNKTATNRFQNLCTLLEDEYGDLPAKKFGPRKLSALRDLFVASGNCRPYVNSQTRNIIRIMKYGVSREVVPPEVIVALDSLEPLRHGQTTAPEGKKRKPVSVDDVIATVKFLSPTLRAMVILQTATGMRPSELFRMRPCDVDRSGDVWLYRVPVHKTAHHGIEKVIPLLGEAREAVSPFLLRDAETPCFSPAESAQWFREQRSANRTTPRSCGNVAGGKRKANPKRQPGAQYSKDSYRRAIERAAEKAGVSHWFPYQLRHLAGTVVRELAGIESAQILLGHTSPRTTEIYAKVPLAKAIEAARVAPRLTDRTA